MMEVLKKEMYDSIFEKLSIDKDLFDSAGKVINMMRDFADLLNDKYPGTTSEEVATFAMQIFWDACSSDNMKKASIIKLANEILKSMESWKK